MATSKRQRQRQRRQVAQQRAKATAVRGRIRSRGTRIMLIAGVIVVAVVIFWLVVRGGDESATEVIVEDIDFPDLPPPPAPGAERTYESAPDQFLDPGLRYSAVFDTSRGVIRVSLDQELSPEAVNAFAVLADDGYYDGTAIFHTDPIGGYIQGGSPHTNNADDPGPGFTVASAESVDYQAGQLLLSAEGSSTGQLLFLAEDDFQPSPPMSGLTVLGQIEDNSLGLIRAILNSHVDDPDTSFGGRPSESVIINSIDIQTTETTPEGSIDLSGCPPADGSGPQVLDFDGPQPMCLDPSRQYTAVFDTTAGEMRIALDVANTPITANNFAVLARYHYYDDTLLFRTDPSIGIIQGGAPHTNSPSDPGPGYTIPDEGSEFTYEPGQIVMARTAAPNSASAQFFFAVNENTALLNNQGTYVVFGQMDGASLAVAEAILASHEDQPGNPLGGGPSPQVIVNSVTIEESG
ncbi:MAG: peptidylprolyl isomerase [bacterium]|nr:peptidylprolyl isomerase [bacterium]